MIVNLRPCKWLDRIHFAIIALKASLRHSQRVSSVKKSPVRTSSLEPAGKSQPFPFTKSENSVKTISSRPGASYPATKTSKIDVDARPVYDPNGKPITEIDLDGGT